MKKRFTITYPAAPERVAAMLADPAYQRGRFERFGLEDESVDVATRGHGFVATVSGSVPPSRLPASAARFVRSAVQLAEALQNKGFQAGYREYAGGHDYAAWQKVLADGLEDLFGK